MKYRKLLLITLIFLILFSCEVNPDISIEGKPIPVLYTAIDKYDSLHYVTVTKTFSGDGGGTLVNAKIWDSIYFSSVKVWGEFYQYDFSDISENPIRIVKTLPGIEVGNIEKSPGIFLNPNQQLFRLNGLLEECLNGYINILIPNYETIKKNIKLVDKPIFYNPNISSGAGIKILEDDPLKIRWGGDISSDIILEFVINTNTTNKNYRDTILYKRYSITHDLEGGFTTTFYYDQMKGLFDQYLKTNPDILSRTIQEVIIIIATCSTLIDPAEYRNDSYVDYFPKLNPNNEIELGKIFSRATDTLKGLELHYLTKEAIYLDPQLSKYRFTRF